MKSQTGSTTEAPGHAVEPLTYAERLHRLTIKKLVEKLEGVAAGKRPARAAPGSTRPQLPVPDVAPGGLIHD